MAFEACMDKASQTSAFQPRNIGNELYFKHGHSRCLSNGNYDPIQCVDKSGNADLCVCVLPWKEENHLTPNGTSAFTETITDLHCFNDTIHDKDYYRPCEKAVRDLQVSPFPSIFHQLVKKLNIIGLHLFVKC